MKAINDVRFCNVLGFMVTTYNIRRGRVFHENIEYKPLGPFIYICTTYIVYGFTIFPFHGSEKLRRLRSIIISFTEEAGAAVQRTTTGAQSTRIVWGVQGPFFALSHTFATIKIKLGLRSDISWKL